MAKVFNHFALFNDEATSPTLVEKSEKQVLPNKKSEKSWADMNEEEEQEMKEQEDKEKLRKSRVWKRNSQMQSSLQECKNVDPLVKKEDKDNILHNEKAAELILKANKKDELEEQQMYQKFKKINTFVLHSKRKIFDKETNNTKIVDVDRELLFVSQSTYESTKKHISSFKTHNNGKVNINEMKKKNKLTRDFVRWAYKDLKTRTIVYPVVVIILPNNRSIIRDTVSVSNLTNEFFIKDNIYQY